MADAHSLSELHRLEKAVPWDRAFADPLACKARATLVGAMAEFFKRMRCEHTDALWMAVRTYDRVVATWIDWGEARSLEQLFVLGGVCLMLSSKFHDSDHVLASELSEWLSCDKATVIALEAKVLRDLEWRVYSPSPSAFVVQLTRDGRLRRAALQLVAKVGLSIYLVSYASHSVAMAAVVVVSQGHSNGTPAREFTVDPTLVELVRRLGAEHPHAVDTPPAKRRVSKASPPSCPRGAPPTPANSMDVTETPVTPRNQPIKKSRKRERCVLTID